MCLSCAPRGREQGGELVSSKERDGDADMSGRGYTLTIPARTSRAPRSMSDVHPVWHSIIAPPDCIQCLVERQCME